MLLVFLRVFKVIIKFFYFFLKLLPIKNKVVFISRQSNKINTDFEMIAESLRKEIKNVKIVFLCKRINEGMLGYLKYSFHVFRQMYHLATSKVCVLDSYCIAASNLKHKKRLVILQIWHSIGKIKKSGYQSLGMKWGRDEKVARIMCMHKNYTNIIAGGKAFNKYYVEGFNCDEKILLNYGLPRIDYLISKEKILKEKILDKYPEFKNKKVVLYAPTFRRYEPFGVKDLIKKYDHKKFILVIKGHPNQPIKVDSKKVYTCPEFKNTDILSVADYVIADYSSICLEAAVLNKRVLFYLYDYEKYMSGNGVNIDPFKVLPHCTSKSIKDLYDIILKDTYNDKEFQDFRRKYLPSKLGNSTKLIVDYIVKHMER